MITEFAFPGVVRRVVDRLRFEAYLIHPKNLWRIREEKLFGKRHSVEVAGRLEVSEVLSADAPGVDQATHYEACPRKVVESVFRALARRVDLRKFDFVDLGSGKGFVLLVASHLPFRQIVGVELSSRLHSIAEQNIGNFSDANQQCKRIRSICKTADSYRFEEAPLICFLYNPFREEVFRGVLKNIEELVRNSGVDVYIVYVNPRNQLLAESPLFELLDSCADDVPTYEVWGLKACAKNPPPPSMQPSRDVQDEAYERLIRRSPAGSIYCHTWWLEAVAPGRWKILKVERQGELIAAWPIVVTPARGLRGPEVAWPNLTKTLGILMAPSDRKASESLSLEHGVIEELLAQLPKHQSFDHRFHESFHNWLPFYWQGFEMTTRYTYVIEGIKDLDRVWADFRSGTRRNIRKALSGGLSVSGRVGLAEFLDLHEEVFERQGMRTFESRALIERLDAELKKRGKRKILGAFDGEGRLLAALYLVWDNGRAHYLMSGSATQHRASSALYLLQWEAIRFASTVADEYDFEGSVIRKIESVNRGFGAEQRLYFLIFRRPPVRVRVVHRIRERLAELKTASPRRSGLRPR